MDAVLPVRVFLEAQAVLLRSKLAEHLMAKEDSVRFYPLCVEKVETIGDSRQRMSYSSLSKLSRERLSDDLAERRLSHGSRRGRKTKTAR